MGSSVVDVVGADVVVVTLVVDVVGAIVWGGRRVVIVVEGAVVVVEGLWVGAHGSRGCSSMGSSSYEANWGMAVGRGPNVRLPEIKPFFPQIGVPNLFWVIQLTGWCAESLWTILLHFVFLSFLRWRIKQRCSNDLRLTRCEFGHSFEQSRSTGTGCGEGGRTTSGCSRRRSSGRSSRSGSRWRTRRGCGCGSRLRRSSCGSRSCLFLRLGIFKDDVFRWRCYLGRLLFSLYGDRAVFVTFNILLRLVFSSRFLPFSSIISGITACSSVFGFQKYRYTWRRISIGVDFRVLTVRLFSWSKWIPALVSDRSAWVVGASVVVVVVVLVVVRGVEVVATRVVFFVHLLNELMHLFKQKCRTTRVWSPVEWW